MSILDNKITVPKPVQGTPEASGEFDDLLALMALVYEQIVRGIGNRPTIALFRMPLKKPMSWAKQCKAMMMKISKVSWVMSYYKSSFIVRCTLNKGVLI